MRYLNQKNYPYLPYIHGTTLENGPITTNVTKSGCGLCSACMMVELLTDRTLDLRDAVKMAEEHGANIIIGTRMVILGPVLAEKYGLTFEATNDMDKLIHCLQTGGKAIINVGGDHDDHVGIFSHGGHYILGYSWDGEDFCILDPSWTPEKFHQEAIKGLVREDVPFLYCKKEVLASDVQNRATPFYLFNRKKPE